MIQTEETAKVKGPEARGHQAGWRERKESGTAGESKVTVVGDKRGNRGLTE